MQRIHKQSNTIRHIHRIPFLVLLVLNLSVRLCVGTCMCTYAYVDENIQYTMAFPPKLNCISSTNTCTSFETSVYVAYYTRFSFVSQKGNKKEEEEKKEDSNIYRLQIVPFVVCDATLKIKLINAEMYQMMKK